MTAILRLLMVVVVAIGSSLVPVSPTANLSPEAKFGAQTGAPQPDGQGFAPAGQGGDGRVTSGAPASVSGAASWYCSSTSACTRGYQPSDLVAAIDTSTGFHQGDVLLVRSGNRSVRVVIVDTCLCRGRRVIDLTSGAFRRLAPLSVGVIPVRVELVGGIGEPEQATPTGPATDVQGDFDD